MLLQSSLEETVGFEGTEGSLEETEGTVEEEEDASLEAFCSSNNASFRFTLEDTLGDLVAEPSPPPPNLFNFNLEEDLERFRLR